MDFCYSCMIFRPKYLQCIEIVLYKQVQSNMCVYVVNNVSISSHSINFQSVIITFTNYAIIYLALFNENTLSCRKYEIRKRCIDLVEKEEIYICKKKCLNEKCVERSFLIDSNIIHRADFCGIKNFLSLQ